LVIGDLFVIHVYRYISALAVLLVLCSAYGLTVAPWLEPPPIERRPDPDETQAQAQIPAENNDELKALFPADHWVHNNPKVFEADPCKLFIQDYQPLENGDLELKPCVLIFYAGAPTATATTGGGSSASRGRPIILEAPRAQLTFDRAVDFKRAEFGRVQKGTLSGDIVIHSPPTAPGARDQLLVRTRAVWLDRESIRTSNEVDFQYGDSSGKGRILEIALRTATPEEKKAGKSKLGAVQTVSLKHLDYLRVATAGRGLLGNALPENNNTPAVAAATEQPPIEVTCQGEFSIDLMSRLARFERQVEVRRLLPGLPPDQLFCEELILAFSEAVKTPAEASASPSSTGDDPLAGRLSRIVGMGAPAVLQAPSSGVHATAAFMEYSMADRYATLKSDQQTPQASLRRGDDHFRAPQLHYQMAAEEGRIGRLHAGGPGELTMVQQRGTERQTITARWQKELLIQPQQGEHVVSLLEQASVTVDPLGRFDGRELHLWVKEVPAPAAEAGDAKTPPADERAKPKMTVTPDRLLAIGSVHVVSQQIDVDTPRLEAWFINVPAEPAPLQPLAPPPRIREPVRPAAFSPDETPYATIRSVVHEPVLQKFHVQGNKIQLRAVVRGPQFAIEDLYIDGQAAIDETRTAEPGQEPLRLRGEWLEVLRGTQSNSTIQVKGHPAEIGARGMWLAGKKIDVFRGRNEMRIDGPGEATMPAGEGSGFRVQGSEPGRQEIRNTTNGPPQKVHIVWQQGLVFDGLTARFAGEVQTRTASQVAIAPLLEATLSRRVDFQALGGPAAALGGGAVTQQTAPAGVGQPELARVFLDGGTAGVYVENRGVNELGEQISREQMRARNLAIDRIAGTMYAAGPGWVSSVRKGSPMRPPTPAATSQWPVSTAPLPIVRGQEPSAEPQQLTSVHVAFEKELVGDSNKRQIEFHQNVLTTYSRATAFTDLIKADPLDKLAEGVILMQSDNLLVRELIQGPVRWFEMEAAGHTKVWGTRADVDAPIITYSSAKDLLTLRGDGRARAKVWMSRVPGQAPSWIDAEEVRYNIRTGELQQDNASNIHIELGPLGPLKGVPNLSAPVDTTRKRKQPSRIP
jgi:hypothetical protein